MSEKERVRPSWQVDAKWIFGLLFTLCLVVSLTAWTLAKISSEEVAVPAATYIVASQFSREGLDDPKDIEEFKKQNRETKQEVFRPLPGQEVTITRQELETLSPRELRLRIFEQVVEPLYRQKRTEESVKERGFLAYLNYETNRTIQQFFWLSLIPLLLTGAGMVAFSYRFGKLISLAVPLLLVSSLPSLMLVILQNTVPPEGGGGPWGPVPRELTYGILAAVSPVYYGLFGLGVSLIGIAWLLTLKRPIIGHSGNVWYSRRS